MKRYQVPIRARLAPSGVPALFVLADSPAAAREIAQEIAQALRDKGDLEIARDSLEVLEPLQVSKNGPAANAPTSSTRDTETPDLFPAPSEASS